MRNAGLDEAQAGIKIAGRNINDLRYADDTTIMAESEECEPFYPYVYEKCLLTLLKMGHPAGDRDTQRRCL